MQHRPWERLVCDYQLWSLLFGLEVVFVRPCWVPSLALFTTLCMVHFALVIFPVTLHTDFCQQKQFSFLYLWMQTWLMTSWLHFGQILLSSYVIWECLTLWTLWYATLLSSYVGVCGVAPRTTGIVVGIPAEVLPQVLRWVPIRIKPTREYTDIIESVNWYCKL